MSGQIDIALVSTPEERAAVFALRMEVFVEEQQVPAEEELDIYDVTATHFLARAVDAGCPAGRIVATARLVDKGNRVGKIGRVAVAAGYRGRGIGAQLMRAIHAFAAKQEFNQLELEAQCYAIPFYEKLGYVAHSDVFLDANIEHRHMSMALTPPEGR